MFKKTPFFVHGLPIEKQYDVLTCKRVHNMKSRKELNILLFCKPLIIITFPIKSVE